MSEVKKRDKRKIIKFWFFKLPIILMIIGAVLIGALKLVERYPEPLRQGFEEYISTITNRNATIGKLEEIKFFPNFIMVANNITVHNASNAAVIDLEIENIKINTPFSSVFFSANKINDFSLTNLKAKKDMFGPKEVVINSAKIINKTGADQIGNFIVAEGLYGSDQAHLEIKLDVNKYNYSIPNNVQFSIRIGEYEVNGALQKNFSSVTMQNVVLSKGDQSNKSKEYLVVEDNKYSTDNPVSCILLSENLNDCDKYLTPN